MADTNRPPEQAKQTKQPQTSPGPVRQAKERVIEDGRPENDNPRPTREELSGTPLGSDPRE